MLAPAGENGVAVDVVDGDGILGEYDSAIGIAEFADSNEGVSEGRHDVAGSGGVRWELGEIQFACGGGVLNVAGGSANANGWGGCVDASAMSTRGEVDIACACVGNCCVSEGEGR